MTAILIAGATIFDATGKAPFKGDLLIEGNRIKTVARAVGQLSADGATLVDGAGLFLMPGMTEGHAHLSFENVAATEDLITPPPEEQVFATARGAKALFDAGFTSAYGASEAKMRLAVAVRNEIDAGRLIGPRIRAGGLEISVTGAMGDESKAHNPRIGPSVLIDGPEEMRKAVRIQCRDGVDNIKLDVSGDPFYPGTPGHSTPMSFEEVKMAADTAHAFGRKINAHARSLESVRYCVEAGIDGIFHAEFSDEATLDLLESAKDRIFVSPTVGLFQTMLMNEAAGVGLTAEVAGYMGIKALMEESVKTHTELRKRGIRHLIGGDYGFAWSAHGTNARDLKFFVDLYGYSPADALVCATRNGGLAMREQGDLGLIAEGQLADLLLIDGDPLADIGMITDTSRIVLIMKDGQIYKNEVRAAQHRVAA
jgi:imidazolonepropionase-like amidohydrolase